MSTAHGKFVWYELMTSDPAGAISFYKDVVGWGTEDSGLPGMDYTLLTVDGAHVGGVMAIPEEARQAGARPAWWGYIYADDLEASIAQAQAAGAKIHRPLTDIPGVGRFAVLADPQGAAFYLFNSTREGAPPAIPPGTPGHIGWHELHAADGKSAWDFYAGLFGWTKAHAMDMGPLGTYQMFATGGDAVGGMLTKMEQMPHPVWLYYFNVAGIDAAQARVTKAGGQVLTGPQEVPGGIWIIHGRDPQGAMFALVGPRG